MIKELPDQHRNLSNFVLIVNVQHVWKLYCKGCKVKDLKELSHEIDFDNIHKLTDVGLNPLPDGLGPIEPRVFNAYSLKHKRAKNLKKITTIR
jgi:hypothetical protein